MAEYLSPGIYVEEIEIGAASIEGVSTSTAAFVGETERGRVEPTLISGLEVYRRKFGDYGWPGSTSHLPNAIEGFFRNGGKRCFIARIIGRNSRAATLDIAGGRADTSPPPRQTPAQTADESAPQPENANPRPVRAGRGQSSDAGDTLFTITAIGPGRWGNQVFVAIRDAGLAKIQPEFFDLVVYYKPTDAKADDEPDLLENYDNLSADPTDVNFYERRINGFSDLITVKRNTDAHIRRPDNSPAALDADRRPVVDRHGRTEFEPIQLRNGSDGDAVTPSDYAGEGGPGERRALAALAEIDEISILCAPNENDVAGLTDLLIDQCENLKSRFAILQAPADAGSVVDLKPPQDTNYGAFYYPWLNVVDGRTGTTKSVPPGGHIAGIYARTDNERGVFKAPANEVVRGIVGLQFTITTGEQDILNPRGVNCIRPLPGHGIRVWGARTASSDPIWRYVNVRRLFIYLEESIRHGTQWVVFEPNNEQLWDRVRQTVTDYLTTVWHDGALMGRTREEAFFVKCDRTTMTENDIETGRLIIVIGVAPVRPAEFVIFRIAQWRGGSALEA